MSADNGIYILKTRVHKSVSEYEYRVKHLQAVENYQWDIEKECFTDDPDIQIENARKMWTDCELVFSKRDAMRIAREIEKEIMESILPILEYGICTIQIERVF